MPQTISTGVLDRFKQLTPEARRTALSRMSEDAKRALLAEIQSSSTSTTSAPAQPVEPRREMNEYQLIPQSMDALRTSGAGAIETVLSGVQTAIQSIPSVLGKLESNPLGLVKDAANLATDAAAYTASVPERFVNSIHQGLTGTPEQSMEALSDATVQYGTDVAPLAMGAQQLWRQGVKGAAKVSSKLATGRDVTSLNSLSSLIAPGIKGMDLKGAPKVAPKVAETIRPYMRQTLALFGIDPDRLPTTNVKSHPTGDLMMGATMEQLDQIAKKTGRSVSEVRALPIEVADMTVDLIHEPIREVISKFKDVRVPTLAKKIEDQLNALAESSLDSGQQSAYKKLAEEAKSMRTIGDLSDWKIYSNKKSAALFDKSSPSADANAMANAAYAYKELGNIIRKELYPDLERRNVRGLTEQARLEVDALDARDGIYATWAAAVGQNAPAALQSWYKKFAPDVIDLFKGNYARRTAPLEMAAKAINREGLEAFNKLFKDSFNYKFDPHDAGKGLHMTDPQWRFKNVKIFGDPDLRNQYDASEPYGLVTYRGSSPVDAPRMDGPIIDPITGQTLKPLTVTRNAPLGYEDLFTKSAKPTTITTGKAKGMKLVLEAVEVDPLTGNPSRWIYLDETGTRIPFTTQQK